MKDLTEPSVTTYHYEYDQNGNRTLVDIKDDNLTLESTVYTYDRLNKLVSSREVTANGLYVYEYTYDDNGNLIQEDRHRIYETNTNQWTNIRRYEYTKDNKLEAVYSGNTLLVAYTYDGDGTITSSLDRDLDFNQNLNINDRGYMNRLTNNQRQLINKVSSNDSFLYELTEYVPDRNQEYSQILMQRDGAGFLSTIYTYGNQRINTESVNNLIGLYTYDGRGSVSAVIGSWGDFRASYWYDGLGNVKSQIHGYGAFGSGKRYFGYNAEQYNPVTGNQNLRARQVNIRRQRFLTEDTYLGNKTDTLSINRYIYASGNPLKFIDPSGYGYIGVQAGASANAISSAEANVGWAFGYNSYEGGVSQAYGTGALGASNSMGGSLSASVSLDWTDNPIGVSDVTVKDGKMNFNTNTSTNSVNISFGLPFKLLSASVEFNFGNSNSIFPTGVTIGAGVGISANPLPITITVKKSWTAANHNPDESIRKSYRSWYVDGYHIANASEISLLDKTNLTEIDEYKLDVIMKQEALNAHLYRCK